MMINCTFFTWVGIRFIVPRKWETAQEILGIFFYRLQMKPNKISNYCFRSLNIPRNQVQKWGVKSVEHIYCLTWILASTYTFKILKRPKMYIIFEFQGYQLWYLQWPLHYGKVSMGDVTFKILNFASHFIRVQIFQIYFPLILSASKYFPAILYL